MSNNLSPMTPTAPSNKEAHRRLKPRIFDTDWLVMRALAREIQAAARTVARPGVRAIDFGCGAMPYKPVFTAAGCGYLGADVDGDPDIRIGGDGRMAAADGSADLVVSFQVLEHVRDLETYFSEALRVLAADGRMILTTHGTWLYHPHPEDHRRWTRQGLVAEIEDHGFEVIDTVSLVGPLGWSTALRLTGYCHVLRKVLIIGPVLCAALSLVMNARGFLEDLLTPRSISNDNACIYLTLSKPKGA